MKKRTYIYAQHGWGFDSSAWHSWLEHIPQEWVFETAERGYFGSTPKQTSMWPQDAAAQRVVVAHSFGLHLVAPEIMRMADALVIISGFKRFHISENAASVRAVRRMQRRLHDDSEGLLEDFYNQCYGNNAFEPSKPTSIPRPVNQVLANDLSLLNTSMVPHSELKRFPMVIILHGDRDQVVSSVHAVQLAELLVDQSSLFFCHGAGHALPFTHPAWCINRIRETLAADSRAPEQSLLFDTIKMTALSMHV